MQAPERMDIHVPLATADTWKQDVKDVRRIVEETISSRLKAVWISHPHADHHLGLVRTV